MKLVNMKLLLLLAMTTLAMHCATAPKQPKNFKNPALARNHTQGSSGDEATRSSAKTSNTLERLISRKSRPQNYITTNGDHTHAAARVELRTAAGKKIAGRWAIPTSLG